MNDIDILIETKKKEGDRYYFTYKGERFYMNCTSLIWPFKAGLTFEEIKQRFDMSELTRFKIV